MESMSITMNPKSEEKAKKYSDHELKHMADTIMQAHEHMADPEIMKMVGPHLDKKMGAVKSIADLRKRSKMKMMAAKEPGEGTKKEEAEDQASGEMD